jgi:hypothetical protein
MSISIVQPLYAGNALRLFLEPPPGAVKWRVLHKGSNSFSGPDDASARIAYEGDERVIVDATALQNEVVAFYRPYYLASDGITWTPGSVASGTPRATYQETSTDALEFVRDRLEAALLVECERGTFQTELGYIQVFTAPPSLERDLRFPLVTVHLNNEEPADRFLGEDVNSDLLDEVGDDGSTSEGWLAQVTLTIIGWTLNPDERMELRKAIRRIVVANLPVLSSRGIEQVSISQEDVDSINGEYPSPMYQVMNTLTCLAPVRISGVDQRTPVIKDVIARSTNG